MVLFIIFIIHFNLFLKQRYSVSCLWIFNAIHTNKVWDLFYYSTNERNIRWMQKITNGLKVKTSQSIISISFYHLTSMCLLCHRMCLIVFQCIVVITIQFFFDYSYSVFHIVTYLHAWLALKYFSRKNIKSICTIRIILSQWAMKHILNYF